MSEDVLANDSDISLLSYLHSEHQFHARDESDRHCTICISVFAVSLFLSVPREIPEGIKSR